MPPAPEVITAGDLFIDLILSGFDGWPEPGQEVFAKDLHREIGGGAVITACGLAKLGVSIAVFGIAGGDSGDWITSRLHANGVDPGMIQLKAEEPNALTVTATGPHDRAFLTYLGASRGFPDALLNAARSGRFSGTRHVHLAFAPAFHAANELLPLLRSRGCTVSLDVGWREDWLSDPGALGFLRNIDIFFPNENEASRLTGEHEPARILKGFADSGISRVALKLGSDGAALLWDGQTFFVEPHSAVPVDPTGAGDSFDAGFLYAWLTGHDPELCLRIASICGAVSTEAFGGIDGLPTLERLERELAKGTRCAK